MTSKSAALCAALVFSVTLGGCSDEMGRTSAIKHSIDAAPTSASLEVPAEMLGNWRSIIDEKATLTIGAKTWKLGYEGLDDEEPDQWRLFSGANPPPGADYSFTPTARYVEVVTAGGERLYYEVGDLTPDFLELFYVGRGNRQAFRKER